MAKLFDSQTRVVPTWLAAAKYLDTAPHRTAMNLLLEISDPLTISAQDRKVMDKVDAALADSELTLSHVAGTIFPLDMYKRYGRPQFYEKFVEMLGRGLPPRAWGTYAQRMIDRPSRFPGERINPLEMIVTRLAAAGQPQRTDGKPVSFASAYELGVADPEQDLGAPPQEDGGELPTYNAGRDGREWLGFPCLSHVTFKRVPVDGGHAVNLTAMYRSHHYCSRALGNLLGLAQLLSFVAHESGLQVGTLSCLSTYAELDVRAWGGVAPARAVLAD